MAAVTFSDPTLADQLASLEKAKAETATAAKEFENKVEAEARAAADAVRKSYRDQLNAAFEARLSASVAVSEFISANATHEWEGKRVVKRETNTSRWSTRTSTTETFGVVEVRRIGTTFPENLARYNIPDMGEAFVRLLKKDGTPGSKIESLTRTRFGATVWALDTEVAA